MAKRQKAAKAERIPSSILEKYQDFEGIKVVERFLENPDSGGAPDIRLKDELPFNDDPLGKRRKWFLRWVDTTQPGRWSTIIDRLGYVPVKVSELHDPEGIAGLTRSEDGTVRMGDKGKEVLVKQPLELYNYRKQIQRDHRERRARNVKLVREDLATAAGQSLGSEAGDFIDGHLSVEMRRTTTTLGEELDSM